MFPHPRPGPDSGTGDHRRLGAALLVSLLLHLGLLLRQGGLPRPLPQEPASPPPLALTLAQEPDKPAFERYLQGPPAKTDSLLRAPVGPPAPPDGQGLAIDMEAARKQARRLAANPSAPAGQQGFQDSTPTLERETALGQAIGRSSRPDCRNAHAGAGLFALPFIVRDAMVDQGCKW